MSQTLKAQGITDAVCSVRRIDQQPTTFVRATVSGKENIQRVLQQGVRLAFCIYRAEIDKRPNQCHKCQKMGHKAANCPSQTDICLRCAGKHNFKNCPLPADNYKDLKCANCNGNHAACSRKCTNLQQAIIAPKSKAGPQARSYADAVRAPVQRQNDCASHQVQNGITMESIKAIVQQVMQETLAKMVDVAVKQALAQQHAETKAMIENILAQISDNSELKRKKPTQNSYPAQDTDMNTCSTSTPFFARQSTTSNNGHPIQPKPQNSQTAGSKQSKKTTIDQGNIQTKL